MSSWRKSKAKTPAHHRSKRPSDAEINSMVRIGEPVRTVSGRIVEKVLDANGVVNRVVYNSIGKVISFQKSTIDRIPVTGEFTSQASKAGTTINNSLYRMGVKNVATVKKRNKKYLG